MRFTVTWIPSGQDELAALWVEADPGDRARITAAANAIDARLQVDPQSAGESRPDGRRILYELPLAVIFEVKELDRIVTVLTVWRV
jgi:hypothetical protein